jgi:Ser/Thr protein kinase RdoA (MazF antagonist)
MPPKIHLTRQDLITIFARYDLGEYIAHQPLTAGTVQTNLRVMTTRGNYVFRLYENRSYESVLFECAVIEHLSAHGFPCPRLYRSRTGEPAGIFDGKPYAIFSFIEGEHHDQPTTEQKSQLIEHIARMHRITAGFQPPHTADRWNYDPAFLIPLAEAETRKIDDENAWLKLDWYRAEIARLELPESLPRGVVHADFDWSNVLVKDGQFTALIDFDDANYTVLIYDIAAVTEVFKPAFNHDTWMNFTPDDDVFDLHAMRETVKIYSRIRPLSALEQRHLYDVCKLAVFVDCLWFYARGDAADFYERRKIDCFNQLGREAFATAVFG